MDGAIAGEALYGVDFVQRRWRTGDEASLVSGLADPDIERFTRGIPFPYGLSHARVWVEETAPGIWDAGGAEFAIDRGDGLAVGSLGFRPGSHRGQRVAVIGYWIAAPMRGRRLAGRALRLAAPWVAHEFGFEHQELVHDLDNMASCRTAEAAGFPAAEVLVGGGQHRDGTPRDVERHVRQFARAAGPPGGA